VAATIVTAGVSFASVVSADLLNGGFEQVDVTAGNQLGAAEWSTFENVYTTANDGPNFAPVSHDEPGNQSILMYGPFFPGGASGAFQSVAVNAGEKVTLEAWAMNWIGDELRNLGILQLSFWDGENGTGNQLGSNIEMTADPYGTADITLAVQDGAEVSDWSQMVVSGVAPAGTVSAKAFLLHIQTADPCCAGGAIYWDDVSLTTSPDDTPTGSGLNIILIKKAVDEQNAAKNVAQ
jgi:hypothetical protein